MCLRVSELVSLRWDQVDLPRGRLHVMRRKQGFASVHPLRGLELRRLQRDYAAFAGHRNTATTLQYLHLMPAQEKQVGFPARLHYSFISASSGSKYAGIDLNPTATAR